MFAVLLLIVPAFALAQDAKPISAEEALKKVNEEVTVELEIKSTGENRNKTMTYLNSEASFRSDKNLTLLIEKKNEEKFVKAGVMNPKDYYKGKTVRVTGKVTLFMDRPQIKLESPEQIKVVEKQ
jgi:DNA/RNA endonuclease YhcR with UshA esterase domain